MGCGWICMDRGGRAAQQRGPCGSEEGTCRRGSERGSVSTCRPMEEGGVLSVAMTGRILGADLCGGGRGSTGEWQPCTVPAPPLPLSLLALPFAVASLICCPLDCPLGFPAALRPLLTCAPSNCSYNNAGRRYGCYRHTPCLRCSCPKRCS